MRIFINAATGLGNIILFLPSFKLLKKICSTSKFYIALDSRWFSDPFIRLQFGEECNFIYIPSKSNGYIKQLYSLFQLRKINFDYSFAVFSGNSIRIGIYLLVVGAKRTIFFKTKNSILNRFFKPSLPLLANEHYINTNYRQISLFVSKYKVPIKWLHFKPENIKKDDNIWIGIHAGGNFQHNSARQWPKDKYKELIKMIINKYDAKILLFGQGGLESNIVNYLSIDFPEHLIKVINNPLNKVANFISNCDVIIGNDSSIMNISVALNIPTLAIIGPTNPYKTGPYGNKNMIASLNLDCMPCYDKGYSDKCPHNKCLENLSPKFVFKKIDEIIYKNNLTFV